MIIIASILFLLFKLPRISLLCEFEGNFELEADTLINFYIYNDIPLIIGRMNPIKQIIPIISEKLDVLDIDSRNVLLKYLYCVSELKDDLTEMDKTITKFLLPYIFKTDTCKYNYKLLQKKGFQYKIMNDFISKENILLNEILYYLRLLWSYNYIGDSFIETNDYIEETASNMKRLITFYLKNVKIYIDLEKLKEEILKYILEMNHLQDKNIIVKFAVECVVSNVCKSDEFKNIIKKLYKEILTKSTSTTSTTTLLFSKSTIKNKTNTMPFMTINISTQTLKEEKNKLKFIIPVAFIVIIVLIVYWFIRNIYPKI